MAKIWRNRSEAETQVFSNCPDKYKKDVLNLMQQDVEDGVITQEEYDKLISL